MAKTAPGAKVALPTRFGLADLGRMALWGFGAAFALTVAAYAGTTQIGRDRLNGAFAELRGTFFPSGATPPRPLSAREGRKLVDDVRVLAAEREQLLARVDGVEHRLTGLAQSITRLEKAAAAQQAAATAEPEAGAADDITASIGSSAAGVPMPSPAPGRNGYGLDLGSGANVEALRTLWTAALRRYSTLLEGLQPLVQTRNHPRPGAPDLHLIAGPLPNAATAARLCAAITGSGGICQPSSYAGQRLALH